MWIKIGLGLLLSFLSLQSNAELLPDAGVIQRELDAIRPQSAPEKASTVVEEPLIADQPDEPASPVTRLIIQGATLIPQQQLSDLFSDYVGRNITRSQCQQLALKLSHVYRQQGWLARVEIPMPDRDKGWLYVNITEAHFAGSEISSSESRVNQKLIQEYIVGTLKPGDILPLQKLESAILQANDLPGVETDAVLESANHPGSTKLSLNIRDLPLIQGSLQYTNYGIRAIGSNQYQGNFSVNNPSGRGDQLNVQAVGSENMVNVRGQYSWLLVDLDTRFSLYGSHLDYSLAGAYSQLQPEGEGRILGGSLRRNLLRSTTQNLYASLSLENRSNQSSHSGIQDRLRNINLLSMDLSGDHQDHWMGLAHSNYGLQLNLGHLAIDLESDRYLDSVTTQAQGDFLKLNLRADRTHSIGEEWQTYLSFTGQWAANNLDSSQKFSLGGPSGVRAFPVNEAMGDSGWIVNLELRRSLYPGLQGFVFVDTGGIHVDQTNWTGRLSTTNNYLLSGIGLGLRFNLSNQWLASASVALPVTHNPGQDIFRHNSDGTRATDPAGWLSLTRVF